MDQEQNPLDELVGGSESEQFVVPTQDKTIRNGIIEMKNQQYLISPAGNSFRPHIFHYHSPIPMKNITFFEEENSHTPQPHDQDSMINRPKEIQHLLSFDDSPRKRLCTPQTQKITRSVRFGNLPLEDFRDLKRNSKGLRNLSKSVYNIVRELKITSYKEVADHLVSMLNSGEFGPVEGSETKSKDEQNIKRRVYDALNVLISADVIQRDGKRVLAEHQPLTSCKKENTDKFYLNEPSSLNQEILRKEVSVREKYGMVQALALKKDILDRIFKRNRKKKYLNQPKIKFPLIGAFFVPNSDKFIDFNCSHTKATLSADQMMVVGDIDLLSKIGIDLLNENIEEMMNDGNENSEEADEGNFFKKGDSVNEEKDKRKEKKSVKVLEPSKV